MHNIELKTVQSSEMTHAARADGTDVTRETLKPAQKDLSIVILDASYKKCYQLAFHSGKLSRGGVEV
jgi:hypothetical protein